jgi:hypothetical protein
MAVTIETAVGSDNNDSGGGNGKDSSNDRDGSGGILEGILVRK